MKNKNFSAVIQWLIVIACFGVALKFISEVENREDVKPEIVLEKSIKNASVSCYAIEGFYPPTIEYLIENYKIQVNEEEFAVFYEAFAENIMPNIEVVRLEK